MLESRGLHRPQVVQPLIIKNMMELMMMMIMMIIIINDDDDNDHLTPCLNKGNVANMEDCGHLSFSS